MTVLVTGGAGRLGNALVRALLERGETVRVLDAADAPLSLEGLDIEHRVGSVLDRDAVDAATDGVDVVYHAAALVDVNPDVSGRIHEVNVEGTRLVAEACRARSARMVHVSSHAALDRFPLDVPLHEERGLALDDPCDYHRSKARAEELVLDLIGRGLDARIVNPGTLTGPYDFEPSMVGRALLDLYHRRVPALVDAVTDYADVRDVADATITAAERGRRGERYLLTGDVVDIREMCRRLEEVTGVRMPRLVLPMWVGFALAPVEAQAARMTNREPRFNKGMLAASISNKVVRRGKAARELGFAPRRLGESMSDAFGFFQTQGWLDAAS